MFCIYYLWKFMEVLILIHTRTNKFNDNPLIPEGLITSIPYHNAKYEYLNTNTNAKYEYLKHLPVFPTFIHFV